MLCGIAHNLIKFVVFGKLLIFYDIVQSQKHYSNNKMLNKNRVKKNILTVMSSFILLALLIKHASPKSEFIFDVISSMLILLIFYKFYDRLHQDNLSYFFLLFTLVLHNLGLYASSPLGIRFDHYMHFVGGFTIAIIFDRFLKESLSKPKRFALVIIFALGIGAIGEIIEWVGYGILDSGEGFFFYGTGDEGEWNNSIKDLIFNSIGAVTFAISTLLRKRSKINLRKFK